jgi:serine/threonine-protein kinase RsbW
MTAKLLLRMLGPMDQLSLCQQAAELLLASVDFGENTESDRDLVLVALMEVVTNVLRHAYEGDESQPIEVEFSCSEESFGIEVRDRGPAFNPLAHDVAALADDAPMPTVAGGFGIHITREVMDDASYSRRDGWNILRLEKRIAVRAERKAGGS